MAKGDRLPDGHQVARYCMASISPSGGISAGVFALKKRDNGELSVDWVDCLCSPQEGRTREASKARLLKTLRNNQPGDVIAFLRTEDIRGIAGQAHSLDVIESPTGNNDCHAAIINLTFDKNRDLNEFRELALLAELAENGPKLEVL